MNEVKRFTNADFGTIRVIDIDGEAWFVGKDVATALGYEDTSKAIRNNVEKEDKNTVLINDGHKGNTGTIIINECGLYSLIYGSKRSEAKAFKRWVTLVILPSFRGNDKKQSKKDLKIKIGKNLKKIAEHYGVQKQIGMLCEESAEFIQAVNKHQRAINTIHYIPQGETINNMKEELADVVVIALQLRYLFGEDEIDEIIRRKINRELGRVGND